MAGAQGGAHHGRMNEKRDRSLDHSQDSPEVSPQARNPSGNTSTAQGETQRPVPRMPHERDESADQQAQRLPAADRVGKQAHADLADGLADTSRSVETDQTYHRLLEGAADGEKDEARQGPRPGRGAKGRR